MLGYKIQTSPNFRGVIYNLPKIKQMNKQTNKGKNTVNIPEDWVNVS